MPKGGTATASAVNIPNGTSTNLLTLGRPNATQDNQVLFAQPVEPNTTITALANITPGTGTTALVFQCVNQFGTVIGTTETEIAVAASPDNFPVTFLDATGVRTTKYTISVTPTGASAAGTCNVIDAYAQTDG